jgi:hypothetical protein
MSNSLEMKMAGLNTNLYYGWQKEIIGRREQRRY